MDIGDAFERLTATPDDDLGMQRTFDVGLTLEELHHGVNKTVTHVRKTQATEGGSVEEERRTLTLAVPPGCESGRRFVFEGEGNSRPEMEPGPVVYNVAQLKHPTFSRAGADLVHVARLPLIDGLCGAALRIPTLDGRTLDIPVSDVVDSGARKVVVGEGMARGDGTRGDLIIVFDLVFPRTLSPAQRNLMRAAFFFPGRKPTPAATKAATAFLNAANDGVAGWCTQGK